MKHKKIMITSIIILSLTLVVIALFNSTYALFSTENYGSNVNSFSTGMLSIEAVSKSENISLTNVLPMSDDDGMQTTPYVFSIKNVGSLNYNFNVKLLSTGESDTTFSANYIKLQIDDGEVTTLAELSNSIIKSDVVLLAGESIDISIRIWLDYNTPNTELGKGFNSRIVTDGKAVYTAPLDGTLANHITNLYLRAIPKFITQPNTGSQYYYASSVGLMSDGLDSFGNATNNMTGGNIRYYGASPNNYLYFNCSDYTSQNDTTCERWRIVGVFNGKVKIVRDDPIGKYSWDYTSTGEYDNNWHDSTLMTLLNEEYYYNHDEVTYYNYIADSAPTAITVNFSSSGKGIKNDKTRNLISNHTWNLGGVNAASSYVPALYQLERGAGKCADCTYETTWTGKIALIYMSDEGFAADFSQCGEKYNGYNSTSSCNQSDWLFNTSADWKLSPNSNNSTSVSAARDITYRPVCLAYIVNDVYPSLYLNASILIDDTGDGSFNNPYRLVVE